MNTIRNGLIKEIGDSLNRNSRRSTQLVRRTLLSDILKELRQPTLPEEPTEELLAALSNVTVHHDAMHPKYPFSYEAYKNLYAALSTPPAPKTKRVVS